MITLLESNPYTQSQEYFYTLDSKSKEAFLDFLFSLLQHKTIIFSKFLESHPYFEEYIMTKNLESYDLTFLENNHNIIHASMQIEQKFLPNILFYDTQKEQESLGVIMYEPFSISVKENLTRQITQSYQNHLKFYICKQDFFHELTLAITLQKHFQAQELHEELITKLLHLALHFGASDIHLFLQNKQGHCLLRLDGVLVHFLNFHHKLFAKISQKLKLLCQLDINETRFPQDGHFKEENTIILSTMDRIKDGQNSPQSTRQQNNILSNSSAPKAYDIRISFFPTLDGESIVLRIPNYSPHFFSLDSLQIRPEILESLKKNLLTKNGLVLISGPTGSGKSTLLYNCLRFLNDGTKKIITIEDPIEQEIRGITQCQIHESLNFSFATALKYVLRQDPDIIMVGEIRDYETLEITLRAALTGHLVLASLHSSDCITSLARLLDLGAKQYLLDSVLRCIVAQRLLKTLCPFCKKEINGIFESHGCHACYHQGYGKRILIQEILDCNKYHQITDSMRESLQNSLSNFHNFQQSGKLYSHQASYLSPTLQQQAHELFSQGIISYEESLL